jgi:acetaldehyde dehydrogenase (acetylating)
MHSESRDAAIAYGAKMPRFENNYKFADNTRSYRIFDDLAPSMTLGCGSWGGNVTSDNVSPIHLMDIKRVAFETKSVSGQSPVKNSDYKIRDSISEEQKPKIAIGNRLARRNRCYRR